MPRTGPVSSYLKLSVLPLTVHLESFVVEIFPEYREIYFFPYYQEMSHSLHTERARQIRMWIREKRKEKYPFLIEDVAEIMGRSSSVVGEMVNENGDRALSFFDYLEYCLAVDADPMEGIELGLKALDTANIIKRRERKILALKAKSAKRQNAWDSECGEE